jgi:methionyl-tRNA formyltransferase
MENLAPWVEGDLTAAPQDDAGASVTSLVEREDGRADWRLAAELLERRCRAYTPWPGLFTDWEGRVLKLLEVQPLESDVAPGKAGIGRVVALEDEAMPVGVATGEGILGLRSLQLEGRRAVSAVEFLRGYSHFIGAQL